MTTSEKIRAPRDGLEIYNDLRTAGEFSGHDGKRVYIDQRTETFIIVEPGDIFGAPDALKARVAAEHGEKAVDDWNPHEHVSIIKIGAEAVKCPRTNPGQIVWDEIQAVLEEPE
ncbi:hypothetical protein COV82_01795 [Candidatus Peregrinibacteria bacterium CG11_big_fil_rev_8_21_14_0_20_46_8]|nr:MAG: hypothetical protein COV82_01795 [Candidatus Peregrinibacteria bacterium CG11_big_fil_rev_8_21_14_0_20_46_8]